MNITINEYWVQFSGKFLLSEPLNRDSYVRIAGEFEHIGYQEKPNEDGTTDAIYKILPIRIMTDVGDRKLIGKVKSRNSQRVRGALWNEASKQDINPENFDAYYDRFTDLLLVHLPEVINMLHMQD